MMLQAADLGIGSCWVGMFKRQEVSDVLELPENIVVTGLLTLGYPAEDAKPLPLHTQYRDRSETITEI
jgi:nitroreductase